MKVTIRKNAASLYNMNHTDFDGTYFGDYDREDFFEKISGLTLEVDTEYLFKYEFNIKPIENLASDGAKISDEYVEKIIDDERSGKEYCENCGRYLGSNEKECNCEEDLSLFW